MTRDLARQLRSSTTDAERLLWRGLREFKRRGFHFRRQVTIGPYIADFACHRAKLIVELDGGQHNDQRQRDHDALRTAFLESQGYRVLRIWNVELFADPVAIGESIFALAKQRSPQTKPPPKIA